MHLQSLQSIHCSQTQSKDIDKGQSEINVHAYLKDVIKHDYYTTGL